LVKAISDSADFELTGAIARRGAGEDIGLLLGLPKTGVLVTTALSRALERPVDVLVDYTSPQSVKRRVEEALAAGVRVVIGTSGLTAGDYADLHGKALNCGLGVVAAGNFSITAALAKHLALFAAKHLPSWEIIDYAQADKPDAPSGSTRELAEELRAVRTNEFAFPVDETHGRREARGATVEGTQIHSLRLPGFVLSFETIFGLPDERLTIRHDAGSGAGPYVAGTLLAVREVLNVTGLIRGLDRLLWQ